ncbi:MAG: hypothetical protein HKN78_00650 [Sphingomonadaceae bacterium]|nr:hypothetical protein [Sphingomonadaceae bacterium]
MYDLPSIFAMSGAGLAGLAIATYAALRGWRGWLELKRLEIERSRDEFGGEAPAPSTGSRIEIADLKERVRKLEAIAAGIEI